MTSMTASATMRLIRLRADGVVVARDHEVDDVGIAVRVDDRDHGDAEAVGLGDRDCSFLVSITKTASGARSSVRMAAEVALELATSR